MALSLVETFVNGNYGTMVSLRDNKIEPVPLTDAIEQLKLVPVDSDLIRALRAVRISFGD